MSGGQFSFAAIIREQTACSGWNLRNAVRCIPPDIWERRYCEAPLWQHVYHTVHSLDRWFINPYRYEEPCFHETDLNDLDTAPRKFLTKQALLEYTDEVCRKITDYCEGLTDEILWEKPEDCVWTRFELIFGQIRHLECHIGMLMGFVLAETGRWPLVAGLERGIPEREMSDEGLFDD